MKVGIFTPVHKINWEQLDALAISINNQSLNNTRYTWHILLNGEAVSFKDEVYERYKDNIGISVGVTEITNNVGALKGEACNSLIRIYNCDLLLEVDYDDLLHKDCIVELIKAAEDNPKAVFFYSNFAHFGENKEGEFESMTYGEYWGWKSKPHKNEELFGNNILNETLSFPPSVQYLYRIESSPNHLRAFRADPYRKIDGYDSSLEVGDDHDLICRFYKEYGEEGFCHINKCLYYQRYDSTTTTHTRNKDIQEQVDKNYVRHSEDMFKRWANDRDLLCLDLGGRFNCPKGYKSVDLLDADYIIDLNKDWTGYKNHPKGFEGTEGLHVEDSPYTSTSIISNSVGVIRAYHVLEHLNDPIHFFNEAYRVLAPGGFLLIEVPSARDYHAFADPTHKSFWTELNFEYYTKEHKAQFIRPQFKGAFQAIRIVEYPWPDGTLCISAQLIALKGWYNDRHWGDKQTDEKYIR